MSSSSIEFIDRRFGSPESVCYFPRKRGSARSTDALFRRQRLLSILVILLWLSVAGWDSASY